MAQVVISLLNASSSASPLHLHDIATPDYPSAVAGNPFVDGWYADPDTEIYNGQYWVYPTTSDVYEKQTYLDAFSSPDLIHWTKHSGIMTIENVTWATKAVWAPAPISRNGKFYLYFGANDIQEDEDAAGLIGGIGVAVADKPEGPYVDAIGAPLIGHYHSDAQPIDQDVFIDDVDGQAYIYYGGHGHANVAKINEDMISVGTLDDGTQFKEITPENYVEGSQMIKRDGIYYFMWSEGGWTGPDYSVSYAMSDFPLGPFERKAKILEQDSAVAKGSGHHGVIHVPGTDIWYIVYHRRPLSETDANHRILAYDRMYFNEDGTISPVKMLVQDNFADGNLFGWKTYSGEWSVVDSLLTMSSPPEGLAMLDTNFTDLVMDSIIDLHGADLDTEAGLVFRATKLTSDGHFSGYLVTVTRSGRVTVRSADGLDSQILDQEHFAVTEASSYQLRVKAVGSSIHVYVQDLVVPKLSVQVSTYTSDESGATGVKALGPTAGFGNISVSRIDSS
jgi:hypothetical protein